MSTRLPGGVQTPPFERFLRPVPLPARPAGMPLINRVRPLTDDERAALMLEVRRDGETAASRRLGLSRNLIARALARLKIQDGSVLLIRAALAAAAKAKAA